MKKKFIIVISSVACILLAANIYAYRASFKIQNHMKELDLSRKKIILLDTFRSDLVKASQSEKLYILTGKDIYQDEFNTSVSSVISAVNDAYDKGYLTNSEKSQLLTTISNYNNFTLAFSPNVENNSLTSDVEDKMNKYNEYQLKVLHQISVDMSSETNISTSNDSKIVDYSNNQTKLIQGVSTFITLLVSSLSLYFKKKLNKENINIDDVFNYLTKPEDNSSQGSTTKASDVEQLKDKVNQSEGLLKNAKLLYTQSVKLQNECKKSEDLLEDIDLYIKKLKTTLEIIDDYPSSAQKIILEDIEKQLITFKIHFKSLPYYNEFISEISKNMIE